MKGREGGRREGRGLSEREGGEGRALSGREGRVKGGVKMEGRWRGRRHEEGRETVQELCTQPGAWEEPVVHGKSTSKHKLWEMVMTSGVDSVAQIPTRLP